MKTQNMTISLKVYLFDIAKCIGKGMTREATANYCCGRAIPSTFGQYYDKISELYKKNKFVTNSDIEKILI